jgi:hypothetical protein
MAEKEVRKTAASSSARKAPPRTVVPAQGRKKPSKAAFVFLFFFVALIGASIGIGYSDKGPIDVTGAITARKQNATPEEQARFSTVPVQQGQNNVVNGGLVGTGKTEEPLVPTTPATTTDSAASSSEAAASSTDAVLDSSDEAPSDTASTSSELAEPQ